MACPPLHIFRERLVVVTLEDLLVQNLLYSSVSFLDPGSMSRLLHSLYASDAMSFSLQVWPP